MREEGYDMTGKGCSDSLLSHPGTPVALSESHDWNKGCRHKYDETLSGTAVKQNLKPDLTEKKTFQYACTTSDFVKQLSVALQKIFISPMLL